jgi:hypothetical protein
MILKRNFAKIVPLFLLSITTFTMSSCRTTSKVADTSHELLPEIHTGLTDHVLGPKIEVCLKTSQYNLRLKREAKKSIETSILNWLVPMRDIDSNVTKTIEFNCPGNMSVDLTNPVERAYTTTGWYPQIHINPNHGAMDYIIFHEMGHAFGLADTYEENDPNGSCKEGQPQSIMCTEVGKYLLADDIAGAKAVFKRTHPNPNSETNILSAAVISGDTEELYEIVIMRNGAPYRLPLLSEYLEITKNATPEVLKDLTTATELDDPLSVFIEVTEDPETDPYEGITLFYKNKKILKRIAVAIEEVIQN